MTDLGSLLSGSTVSLNDSVQGSFTYDSDLSSSDSLLSFSISLGSNFTANSTGSSYFNVQNDQQNGSATQPADGFTVGSGFASTSLNGYTTGGMQFGVLKDNADGQLWSDTLLPDLSDWANISLADINNPDWHWMDFGAPTTGNFRDDQIRWDISSFKVSPVPEPSTLALMALGLAGIGFFARRKTA